MIDLKEEVIEADEAFALDWYKDDDGYTNIGQAVYNIKYGYIQNGTIDYVVADKILDYLVKELCSHIVDIDLIIPIPSYNPRTEENSSGDEKIMYLVSEKLRLQGFPVEYSLQKTSDVQAKSSQLSKANYISSQLKTDKQVRILVIDDLFGTGNTANYSISALKSKNPNAYIKFISLTKNRFGGIHKKFICTLKSDGVPRKANNGRYSIILHFEENGHDTKVWLWEDNSHYQEVQTAYDNREFNKKFEFFMYKNQKGFWCIDD